ncbi:MAG: fumarylacetoacetate hydrolase family protein [Chloroflexi bacterium]|nr:fumarylacetoacetate hydrolase family protein [Chloroflexota bacterium]
MRWCRFRVGEKVSYGLVEGDEVAQVMGTPFGRHRRTGTRLPLSEVKLLVPCVPPTFYAAGVNYMDHVTGTAALLGRSAEPPAKPDIGYRANNALTGHGDPIVIPGDATQDVQYEGELVVVISKQAKDLREDQVWDYILGYTIGNDVSERTWQHGDRTLWRAKNADTFKPMGPWIDTEADPAEMRTTVRLNHRVVADFATNNMIYGIATYLSVMTKYITLYPGDVVWMGTDGIPQNMKPGDVVEVEISGIGTLQNPVLAEGT